jgi:putative glutamine amidotransferase
MENPVIGITTRRLTLSNQSSLIGSADSYIQAILKAGGSPVLLPIPLSGNRLADVVKCLDGVLFIGGGDIDPELYRGEAHPSVYGVEKDRDVMEMTLVDHVMFRRLPFLGICRGLQVINVALGGTLYADINSKVPNTLLHEASSERAADYKAHPVRILPGTRLAGLLKAEKIDVNSLHHQGIDKLGTSLTVSAIAPDGIIEGIEIQDHPFGMAVQWHPEILIKDPPSLTIFKSFIEAAALFRSNNP